MGEITPKDWRSILKYQNDYENEQEKTLELLEQQLSNAKGKSPEGEYLLLLG